MLCDLWFNKSKTSSAPVLSYSGCWRAAECQYRRSWMCISQLSHLQVLPGCQADCSGDWCHPGVRGPVQFFENNHAGLRRCDLSPNLCRCAALYAAAGSVRCQLLDWLHLKELDAWCWLDRCLILSLVGPCVCSMSACCTHSCSVLGPAVCTRVWCVPYLRYACRAA